MEDYDGINLFFHFRSCFNLNSEVHASMGVAEGRTAEGRPRKDALADCSHACSDL